MWRETIYCTFTGSSHVLGLDFYFTFPFETSLIPPVTGLRFDEAQTPRGTLKYCKITLPTIANEGMGEGALSYLQDPAKDRPPLHVAEILHLRAPRHPWGVCDHLFRLMVLLNQLLLLSAPADCWAGGPFSLMGTLGVSGREWLNGAWLPSRDFCKPLG